MSLKNMQLSNFIAHEWQNQGYGKQFLESIIEQLQVQSVGVNAMILNTERSYPAFRFYKSAGFEALSDYAILARHI